MRGKALPQSAWLAAYGWDNPLDLSFSQQANAWWREVPQLGDLHIPRSLKRATEINVGEQQQHIFVDASQTAYGAVCYSRHQYRNEASVSLRLVALKLKVAHLSAQSIPRLELMAAVIGVNLAKAIQTALGIGPDQGHSWSDMLFAACYFTE